MSQIDMYRFVEGAEIWTVTSSDIPVEYAGEIYAPMAIGRTDIESKSELSKANIEVSMAIDNPIGHKWISSVVDGIVTLTVFTKEFDSGAVQVAWKGRLSGAKPNMSQIKLVFESVFTSMRRTGLRRRFQIQCPYVLYGRGCFLNMEEWGVDGTATAATGNTVVVAAAGSQANGWYLGGMIKAPDGTLRFITGHVGTTLTLIRPIESLVAAVAIGATAVRIYPGCDRTRVTCNGKFNNLLNNGSTPFIPKKNPFGGNSFV